ncbi:hypothetical protein TTHERM_000635748 (macronuclear) [Tetrahymena thermophila SB210]|uniref:Uncharacterized protein n=1 Tax=Tetrahymena thermophila (strain SB210) TaxID=312017 RepID=W7X926_TETTS|nr:hypothetical protein TTHERM_000635748 [Tetrahymena thermophila SB210]EWS75900.1 hypothetical protein TTHERM_000635748 [Tetrahymena thermophila SB210]|eukprot:XP_012651571.1 hypothetical protein TTHERM_000635748 [Tetrahymena thermophila SB210]
MLYLLIIQKLIINKNQIIYQIINQLNFLQEIVHFKKSKHLLINQVILRQNIFLNQHISSLFQICQKKERVKFNSLYKLYNLIFIYNYIKIIYILSPSDSQLEPNSSLMQL